MLSLKEAKAAIYQTECGELILDGLYCSEPIMTYGEKGIVDNYFVFSADRLMKQISSPIFRFGIYSDRGEVAYVLEEEEQSTRIDNELRANEDPYQMYQRYSDLYPIIRSSLIQGNCNVQEKKDLKEYCSILRSFSGSGLWNLYKKLYPTFFDWVADQMKTSC